MPPPAPLSLPAPTTNGGSSHHPLPDFGGQSHSSPERSPNGAHQFTSSQQPLPFPDDGFNAYAAHPGRDPWQRKAHKRDREMEPQPQPKMKTDRIHMKAAALREEQHGAAFPAGSDQVPPAVDDDLANAPSTVRAEAVVEAPTSSNIDVGKTVTTLVNELLYGAETVASGGEDDRSNYSDEESTRRQKKDKLRARGKAVSDTDEDDLQAEAEMLDDVVDEDGHSARRPIPGKKRKSLTTKAKGKQRAVEHHSSDSDGECRDDLKSKGHFTPGPLSAEARTEARELGEQTQEAATLLSKKYNKPYETIMVAAGLGIQNTRQGTNFSNQYKKWYKAKYPKADGGECLFL